MIEIEHYRHHAADCVRQAHGEATAEDKDLLLNIALAWLRLARQREEMEPADSPASEPDWAPDRNEEAAQHEMAS